MKTKIIALIILIIIVAGGIMWWKTMPVALQAPADITLGVGKTGEVGDLEITFNKLVQDSRCPIDVQCIQAGAVNTNVTFKDSSNTKTFNMPSDEVPQEFGAYKISIAAINPPRQSKHEIAPTDYQITFHVDVK